ncbi:Src1p NDAI_0C00790 [Naumovozyma dairenensis CBS 421]|uniref:Man1/Src1 C-terminal domain-containing protein n=1 Tax=Naumovozyma dairenensis (strain ATCC 10597 / BCRC 20456 / CBS 421 / NBRC 0211 / NRRL Y-12639) TaxID=1071378 RepID=G0W7H9_NAUDC|nr:hypothetical protein NDAI_0C00790 [Naumovozyma dairenensis CBS 421]CCD23740.1 hypothetical protein NDAI_0C00790 [Naumovozyma dairenensis CBS 421]
MNSDTDYLKPGFNFKKLRVPDLRRILTENHVTYLSSSKKSDLLKLFKENIEPRLPELREIHLHAQPSSEGIIDTNHTSGRNTSTSQSPDIRSSKHGLVWQADSDSNLNSDSSDSDSDSLTSFASQIKSKGSITPKPKKRKIGIPNDGTPIVNKVSKKSPSKSPNKSTSINNFDLSSGSDSETIEGLSINRSHPHISPNKGIEGFFHQENKNAGSNDEDPNKLKEAAAHVKPLAKLIKNNEKKKNIVRTYSSFSSDDSDIELEYQKAKRLVSGSNDNTNDESSSFQKEKDTSNRASTPTMDQQIIEILESDEEEEEDVGSNNTEKSLETESPNIQPIESPPKKQTVNTTRSILPKQEPSSENATPIKQKEIGSEENDADVNDNTNISSSEEESSSKSVTQRITTPELPTAEDVQESEDRVEELDKILNEEKTDTNNDFNKTTNQELIKEQVSPTSKVKETQMVSSLGEKNTSTPSSSKGEPATQRFPSHTKNHGSPRIKTPSKDVIKRSPIFKAYKLASPKISKKAPFSDKPHISNQQNSIVKPIKRDALPKVDITQPIVSLADTSTTTKETSSQKHPLSQDELEELSEMLSSTDGELEKDLEPEDNDINMEETERSTQSENETVSSSPLETEKVAITKNGKRALESDDVEEIKQVPKKKRRVIVGIKKILKTLCSLLKKIILLLLLIIPVIIALWYREQRIMVGYCGTEVDNRPSLIMRNVDYPYAYEIDSALQTYLKPECLPCPENAICYSNMEMKCRPKYRLVESRWNLFGLLPVSASCQRDDQRDQLVSEVVKKSLEFLRTKNAQIECGRSTDDIGSGLSEEELYEIFNEARVPWIDDDEFNDIWNQVISNLKEEPEVIWRQVSTNFFFNAFSIERPKNNNTNIFYLNYRTMTRSLQRIPPMTQAQPMIIKGRKDIFTKIPKSKKEKGTFRSTSTKHVSVKCKFQWEIYETYRRNRYLIWTGLSTATLAKIVEKKLKNYFEEKAKIVTVTRDVLKRLQKVKKQGSNPPYLSSIQLRDIFLADVVDFKRKAYLWKHVEKNLEHNNSNIKSTLMEIHGDIMKCWEWIGPLDTEDEEEEHENLA